MPTISHASPLVTTINVFCVAPEDQQQAFQALAALARQLLDSVPGLLSASFHLSTDGKRIVNYAQYDSLNAVKAVETMLRETTSSQRLTLQSIAQPDFHTYSVAAIIERTETGVREEKASLAGK